MSKNKVLNFDLFMQEKEKKTLDVTVYGDTYTVSMEIPAIVPVMMARAEESINGNDSTKAVMRAADALFGQENVDKMCRKGISATDLVNLVQKVFGMINGQDQSEDDSEELTDDDSRVGKTGDKNAKK